MEIHIVSADDVGDTAKLEEKAASLAGENVVLDSSQTIGKNFQTVDSSVRAILIIKKSAEGAVRVFGKDIRNVVTGPNEDGFVIVAVKEGETCRLLGTPTIRYFRCLRS
ncbi:hypothetical protein I7I51_03922 [Histoplasma capsulatum]|uniref:Uncharacterized protein n=1 Tax=Ajellomyces capsulatus TaxID=5037 RepID=A0A8A1M7R4_AJECA|nr:hypothetical protein I7I51_03922 [Histoplasma capsulatum]